MPRVEAQALRAKLRYGENQYRQVETRRREEIARANADTIRALRAGFAGGGEAVNRAVRDLQRLAETVLPPQYRGAVGPMLARITTPDDAARVFVSFMRLQEKAVLMTARERFRQTWSDIAAQLPTMPDVDRAKIRRVIEAVTIHQPTPDTIAAASKVFEEAARLEADPDAAGYIPDPVLHDAGKVLGTLSRQPLTVLTAEQLDTLRAGLMNAMHIITTKNTILAARELKARAAAATELVRQAPRGQHTGELDVNIAAPPKPRGVVGEYAHELYTDAWTLIANALGDTDAVRLGIREPLREGTREGLRAYAAWHQSFTETGNQLFGNPRHVHELLDAKRDIMLPSGEVLRDVTNGQVARWVGMLRDGDTLAKFMRNRDKGINLSGVLERGSRKFTLADIETLEEALPQELRRALDAYGQLRTGPMLEWINQEAVKFRGYEAVHEGEEWRNYYPRRTVSEKTSRLGVRGTQETPDFLERRTGTTAPLNGAGNIFSDMLRQMGDAAAIPRVRAAKQVWGLLNEPAIRKQFVERYGVNGAREAYRDFRDYLNAYSGLVIDHPARGENAILRMLHRGMLLWNLPTMLNVGVSVVTGPMEGITLGSTFDPRNLSAEMRDRVQQVIDHEPILRARLGLEGHDIMTPYTAPENLAKQVLGIDAPWWTPAGSLQPADRGAVYGQIAGAIREIMREGTEWGPEALARASDRALTAVERTQAGTDPMFVPIGLLPGRATFAKRV
ncbi:MAG: hypothetical protein V1790_07800, partial [Planctomycetota bacterium]